MTPGLKPRGSIRKRFVLNGAPGLQARGNSSASIQPRIDQRVSRASDALVQAEGLVERALVLHAEAPCIAPGRQMPQHRRQVDVTFAELAELARVEAFQVDMSDKRRELF